MAATFGALAGARKPSERIAAPHAHPPASAHLPAQHRASIQQKQRRPEKVPRDSHEQQCADARVGNQAIGRGCGALRQFQRDQDQRTTSRQKHLHPQCAAVESTREHSITYMPAVGWLIDNGPKSKREPALLPLPIGRRRSLQHPILRSDRRFRRRQRECDGYSGHDCMVAEGYRAVEKGPCGSK